MFKSNSTSDVQKKWIMVSGLLTVLGFSTSFHHYDSNPKSSQFAQLGAPEFQEGSIVLSSVASPDDDSEADNSREASATVTSDNSSGQRKSVTVIINGRTYPVTLSIAEDREVEMRVQLNPAATQAFGIPCHGDGNCNRSFVAGLGVTAKENLDDLSKYKELMAAILKDTPLARLDSGTSHLDPDKVAESEDTEEESTEQSASEKKLADMDKKCEKKESAQSQLTCRMDKLKSLLSKRSNKIDKDAALEYYKDNVEEALQNQFVSFAAGDYALDQAKALNPQQAQSISAEMQSSFSDFSLKSRELLAQMKDLQSSILSEYSEIRESLTNMSVQVLGHIANKSSEYARNSRQALAQGRSSDATANLQALSLQRELFQNVYQGLNLANQSGLSLAAQNEMISRPYANNMSATVRDFGSEILTNFNSLGQLDPMTAQSIFSTRLSALDDFDYSAGRPNTILLNGGLYQLISDSAKAASTSATASTAATGGTPGATTLEAASALNRPAPQEQPQQLQQIRGGLSRGAPGTAGTFIPPTSTTDAPSSGLRQGPVAPFTGF
jgi:hypothetical protein